MGDEPEQHQMQVQLHLLKVVMVKQLRVMLTCAPPHHVAVQRVKMDLQHQSVYQDLRDLDTRHPQRLLLLLVSPHHSSFCMLLMLLAHCLYVIVCSYACVCMFVMNTQSVLYVCLYLPPVYPTYDVLSFLSPHFY
jgi:hypothetical protein